MKTDLNVTKKDISESTQNNKCNKEYIKNSHNSTLGGQTIHLNNGQRT